MLKVKSSYHILFKRNRTMNISLKFVLVCTFASLCIVHRSSARSTPRNDDDVIELVSANKRKESHHHEPRNSTSDDGNKKQCSCGVRRGSERIVGGTDAEINEFPWRCALFVPHQNGFKLFCGCSVLNEKYIMTAAHCTNAVKGRQIYVDAGDHDLTTTEETENQFIKVGQVHQHPQYSTRTFDNDISILELKTELDMGGTVEPVCLPFKFSEQDFTGKNIIASGWGTKKENGRTSAVLQKVDIPLLTTEECIRYFPRGQISENMLCTLAEGKDTCQGDSGSSIDLKDEETGQYYGIGIVSFGYGCARNNSPGVYTKVTNYLKFIESVTGDNLCKS